MCGIAGIAGPGAATQVELLRCMRDRIAHRGPDSAGEHIEDSVILGVRRLRVIDLRTGDQPISNEDGTTWTVFNGEIYNFRELRDELMGRGHRFTTGTDTEVIVHLYEEHGEDFVARLDGMFALAVWDSRERRLILARDRLGKKPLLYAKAGERLIFASEHAALLPGLTSRGVDPLSVLLYLRLGYVPAPHDAFEAIAKLPPATVLTWQDGRIRTARYWHPPAPGSLPIGERDAVEALRAALDRAVRRRLIADVPIGAFLSGGLDSSAVVATMAREGGIVRTFTIGFDDARYSELEHARSISQEYATDHHEFVVRALDDDVIVDLVRHLGEPYADSSAVPTYHLSRLTRQHVTVALNGDGRRIRPLSRSAAGGVARSAPAPSSTRSGGPRAPATAARHIA
jgi:asparagine synthase (glutamine-hydrolysing)